MSLIKKLYLDGIKMNQRAKYPG